MIVQYRCDLIQWDCGNNSLMIQYNATTTCDAHTFHRMKNKTLRPKKFSRNAFGRNKIPVFCFFRPKNCSTKMLAWKLFWSKFVSSRKQKLAEFFLAKNVFGWKTVWAKFFGEANFWPNKFLVFFSNHSICGKLSNYLLLIKNIFFFFYFCS